MTSFRCSVLLCLGFGLGALHAQTPTVTQPLPAVALSTGAPAATVDLTQYFGLPGVTGQVVQVATAYGRFNIELLADDAPLTVANFLGYVNAGSYNNALIHRSVPGFVIQTGGFIATSPVGNIASGPMVKNEFKRSNIRGTLAMAKLGSGPDTATNQWFVNLANNAANLDNQNGGFTVFARVLGTGMVVADAIAALPIYNFGSPFDSLPLRNYNSANQPVVANFIALTSVRVVPIHPVVGGQGSVFTYSVSTGTAGIVTATISGSTLTLTPVASGSTTVTVRSTDSNANFIESTFTAQVTSPIPAPTITQQPPSSIAAGVGQTVVLNVVAAGEGLSYQWKRVDDSPNLASDIAGATTALLVLSNAQVNQTGSYFCSVSNGGGSVNSQSAAVTVAAGATASRLTNLAVRSFAGAGEKALIAGFVTRGAGSKPLAVRGIGPALLAYGVTAVLDDPSLELRSTGAGTPVVGTNDNWTGDDGRNYGGFPLNAGSKDSVLVSPLAVGGYTAQVRGAGGATGNALVEVYDAATADASSSFVNLSARTQLDAGQILIAGVSVSAGANKTLLIRAVGPKLADFGVGGVLSDPKIEVYNSSGTKIMENDNWGGTPALTAAAAAVGAFGLEPTSKDAALAMTLPAGGYTVWVSGVGGAAGVVLVEVYEYP
ncbi:MAG: peptidylprolyl isomerase [Opitutaceae bacterium]